MIFKRANYSQRRDVIVEETGNTPRYLSNVIHSDIVENGNVIPSMYYGTAILRLLENIVSDKVYRCPYEPEQLLISRQEFSGDTHGWHWGDYSYALICIIDTPAIEIGGLLQCIPHTRWDKQNPRINEHLVNNLIQSYYHNAGDVYLLKTDTTLHRTVPLNQDAQRTILRMGYACAIDLNKEVNHNTMQKAFE